MKNQIKLFALPNADLLGEKVSKKLGVELSPVEVITFADGEVLPTAKSTVRNQDVFVIASAAPPVNNNYMLILLFIDSLKRASAKSVTLVLTYYGYARQDRKAAGRQPIGAKLIADLLETAGATKVIAVDLHNPSIQGFFDIPLDDLKGQYILAKEIGKVGRFTVVSPDHGGANRARLLAQLISETINIAIVDKRRTGTNEVEIFNVLGDVKGKNVVIIDDIIDTGSTIIKASEALKKEGALKVVVAATHGLFSKGFENFDNSKVIDQVIVTDSICGVYKIKSPKLKIVSLDQFISDTILATIDGKSVTTLYEDIKKGL